MVNEVTGARYVTRFLQGNKKVYRNKNTRFKRITFNRYVSPEDRIISSHDIARFSPLRNYTVPQNRSGVQTVKPTSRDARAPPRLLLALCSERRSQCGFPSERNGASDWSRRGHGVSRRSRLGSMEIRKRLG